VESSISRFLSQQGHRQFLLQRGDVWWQSYQELLEFSELQLESNKCECGPMQISYDSTNGYAITRVLTNLLESTKKWLNDEEMGLDRDDIAGGCALYAFDTQPDFDGNEYLSLKKQENVRIDAHFNTALPNTVNCIVLAEKQGYFEISQSRYVIID
jgi:hypothetical protein